MIRRPAPGLLLFFAFFAVNPEKNAGRAAGTAWEGGAGEISKIVFPFNKETPEKYAPATGLFSLFGG